MEHITVLENLRELAIVTVGITLGELIKYLTVKVATWVDSKHESFLDVDE